MWPWPSKQICSNTYVMLMFWGRFTVLVSELVHVTKHKSDSITSINIEQNSCPVECHQLNTTREKLLENLNEWMNEFRIENSHLKFRAKLRLPTPDFFFQYEDFSYCLTFLPFAISLKDVFRNFIQIAKQKGTLFKG